MTDSRFPRLVSLACHDLRTPLATVYGFSRTLSRGESLDDRSARFLGMIEEASQQMTELLDQLGTLARIEDDRYEPGLREADTLELARFDDERIETVGGGETVETDSAAIARALQAFAICAVRHGSVERVRWEVRGREFRLSPVSAEAAPIVLGEDLRDLGAAIGRRVVETLGGSVALQGDTLVVRL